MIKEPIKWLLPVFFKIGIIPTLVATNKTNKPVNPVRKVTKEIIKKIMIIVILA